MPKLSKEQIFVTQGVGSNEIELTLRLDARADPWWQREFSRVAKERLKDARAWALDHSVIVSLPAGSDDDAIRKALTDSARLVTETDEQERRALDRVNHAQAIGVTWWDDNKGYHT